MTDKLHFTGVNYDLCMYCSKAGVISGKIDDAWLCSEKKSKEGHFKIFSSEESDTTVDESKGCSDFESCGMSAHPSVREELIKQNPLAENIPSDDGAIETSYEFASKRKSYEYTDVTPVPVDEGEPPKYRTLRMKI